jgi:dipeptidase E
MKRREFIASSVAGSVGATLAHGSLTASASASEDTLQARSSATRRILIAGGNFNTPFIRYMAQLTGKPRPKLLYLPTASADSESGTITWYRNCAPLNVEPSHQISFIASTQQPRSWEEVLLSVDGIVCSGGNTLNQQAIWKAQGMDVILRQAWDRGIVLGGASAGSLCWFEHGTTDSRPKELSKVECLGFIKGSHSPHYDAEPGRRPLYQKMIASGEMKPGYACDNDAGIYFEDNALKRAVSTRPAAKVYYVSVEGGKIVEKVIEPEHIA